MKTLVTIGLVGLVALKAITSTPRLILNSVGLGFKDEFKVGDKSIKRPVSCNTKAHKAAFENVGYYVASAMTRDVMISYKDRDLATDNFLRPSGIPLEVWHEVLEFFVEQGFIEERWEMRIMRTMTLTQNPPSTYTYRSDVSWGPNGEELEKPKFHLIGGIVPDSAHFTPSLLTKEQKQALLGTQYALEATANLAWKKMEQEYVTLTDDCFERVFVRPRSLFSDAEKHDAAVKVAEMINLSQD